MIFYLMFFFRSVHEPVPDLQNKSFLPSSKDNKPTVKMSSNNRGPLLAAFLLGILFGFLFTQFAKPPSSTIPPGIVLDQSSATDTNTYTITVSATGSTTIASPVTNTDTVTNTVTNTNTTTETTPDAGPPLSDASLGEAGRGNQWFLMFQP